MVNIHEGWGPIQAALEQPLEEAAAELGSTLGKGVLLMTIAGIGFIGYGIVLMMNAVSTSLIYGALFWFLDLITAALETDMDTLVGASRGELDLMILMNYLRAMFAGFLVSTGIAITALSWFGVRKRVVWAWATAVVSAGIGLLIVFPFSYLEGFVHTRAVHLGPIYLAGIVFGAGAVLAFQGLRTRN